MVMGEWSNVLNAIRRDVSRTRQDLTDRVNQVIDRQDGMFDHVKNGANGNENEEVGDLPTSEGNDYSSELIGISAPLRLIRQLIPIKIVELHLPGCSGTAAVVAKRSTGMAFPRNRHRRPQTNLTCCGFVRFQSFWPPKALIYFLDVLYFPPGSRLLNYLVHT